MTRTYSGAEVVVILQFLNPTGVVSLSKAHYYFLGVPNFANYESSAALVEVPKDGGEIRYVCIGEDRLTRKKLTYTFPLRGIDYCLDFFGLDHLSEIDGIVTDYARVPRWNNSGPGYRKLEHDYLKLHLDYPQSNIQIVDHHDAHAASCYYPSGFDEAAILIVDGMGSDLETQSLYQGKGDQIELLERGYGWGIGKLYSIITGGVLPYGPEKGFGKVMGLAPYGEQQPKPVLDFLSRDEGMTTDYSRYFSRQPVSRLVTEPAVRCTDRSRVMEPQFTRAAYDIQIECERQLVRMAEYAYEKTGCKNLCMAGGVILNGRSNHVILERTPIESIWMPPCVSDTGIPFGLALWGAYQQKIERRPLTVAMPHAYTGRDYEDDEVIVNLKRWNIEYTATTAQDIAQDIVDHKVIAWFDGASEYGPRALGHRSILADPRSDVMKDALNAGVKFRENYRPYAPSVLEEYSHEWFALKDRSPFMLQVCHVHEDKRALIPSVTHIDGTARVQEVSKAHSPNYWRLIDTYRDLTGVPLLLNTSFNVNREPIVESPVDAMICAFGTKIDYLVFNGKFKVECARYRTPERVQALMDARANKDDQHYQALCDRFLKRYDQDEMDRFLAIENEKAEWHLNYGASYQLDSFIKQCAENQWKVLLVGTKGHTEVLHDFVYEFTSLNIQGLVDIKLPGEAANSSLSLSDEFMSFGFDNAPWDEVDAILVSTHEYQREAMSRLADLGQSDKAHCIYDDAMDSLYYQLPEKAVRVRGESGQLGGHVAVVDIDDAGTANRSSGTDLGERYGFMVNYHHVRPSKGAFFEGLNHVTPEALEHQIRQLIDNFEFSTLKEVLDPSRSVNESVAMITFDDSLRDVVDYAAPVLQRYNIPASVYVPSQPYLEKKVLLTHQRQLVSGKLGFDQLGKMFYGYADDQGVSLSRTPDIPENLYPFDKAKVRALKYTMNYCVDDQLVANFIGEIFADNFDHQTVLERLYISRDDLLRLQDLGWQIGGHGHSHRPLSSMTDAEQAEDISTNFAYLKDLLDQTPHGFAYPFGKPISYNTFSEKSVAEAGFACASVVDPRVFTPTDLANGFTLPRFDVNDLFDREGRLNAACIEVLSTGD